MEPTRLDHIPAFADLTAEERAEVSACLREVTIAEGTSLVTQGDNAYHLFVIESGHADVLKDGEIVRTLGPGDVLGEIGVLATGTRTASVVATSPMQLLAMFLRELNEIESRVPALGEALRKTIADHAAGTGF